MGGATEACSVRGSAHRDSVRKAGMLLIVLVS